MKELQIFKNEQFGEVRVKEISGQVWFCLKDICNSLEIKNVSDCKERLNSKGIVNTDALTNGGTQKLLFINESNLYKTIFQSRKEEAEKFQDWVTDEVLPSIRKHGMYATDELINNPDLLIAAATKIKEERAARLEAEKERNKLIHQGKLYTTGEIAKELNLSSATKLNNLLSENKIQFKQNGTWLLYSKYSEMNFISIKQQQLDNGKVIYDRKWTGIGRDFILNLLK